MNLRNATALVTGGSSGIGQSEDIAHIVRAVLEMNDRGFTTELTVLATNPKD